MFSARHCHTTAHIPCFCVHSPNSRIRGAQACRRKSAEAVRDSERQGAQPAANRPVYRLRSSHLCRVLLPLLVSLVTPAVRDRALSDMRRDRLSIRSCHADTSTQVYEAATWRLTGKSTICGWLAPPLFSCSVEEEEADIHKVYGLGQGTAATARRLSL